MGYTSEPVEIPCDPVAEFPGPAEAELSTRVEVQRPKKVRGSLLGCADAITRTLNP